MNPIQLKKIGIQELDRLQKIGKQTFYETFSEQNTEQNMKEYLESGFSSQKLADELNDPNTEFYFASLDNAVIGYLKLNFGQAQTEIKDEKALEIERIYVLKAYHGQKVGQLLYEKALEVAKSKNSAYLWLGVWEKNLKAIHFYKKNGFFEFDKHIFVLGDDPQTDIMMKLYIQK